MIRRIFGGLLGAVLLSIGGLATFAGITARRVSRQVPPTGRFVTILGQRVHFTDRGAGPSILIIHGLGGQTRNFPEALLARLASHHRVVVLDRPGSGHSIRPFATPTDMADQATTIAAFIERLGLGRPLVVGHSFGGALALGLALDHPSRVGALALIAPLTQPVETVPDAFRALAVRSKLLRLLIAWTLAVPGAIRGGETALRQVFGPDPVPADHPTTGGGLLALRPQAYFGASTDLVAAGAGMPPLSARLPSLRLPVGILFGTADRILNPALHGEYAVAQIEGATLELIPDAGHMLPVIHPAATAAFIERVAGRLA